MTTEVCTVHILWIFRITTITPAKSPIQNCLRGGFRERVKAALIVAKISFLIFNIFEKISFIFTYIKTFLGVFLLLYKNTLFNSYTAMMIFHNR